MPAIVTTTSQKRLKLCDNPVTSVPEITRMLARIQDWQEGHGKPGGRAEAARRLDEAHKLLDEVHRMLTEMRRTLLGSGRQR